MELLGDPGFRVYAICAAILALKMWATGNATGLLRVMRKNFITSEDFAFAGEPPKPPDEQIERLRNAHRNDLENVLPFLVIAFIYVLTGPSYSVLWWILVLFTLARVGHTVVYALGLQPWRTIFFEVGNVSFLVMIILLFVNLA